MKASREMEKLEEILLDLREFLEAEDGCPDKDRMRKEAKELMDESEAYREELRDQRDHSRSITSRDLAGWMLKEDEQVRQCLTRLEKEDGPDGEHDLCALALEYLEGRARQSLREALLGTICLKLELLEEKEREEGSLGLKPFEDRRGSDMDPRKGEEA